MHMVGSFVSPYARNHAMLCNGIPMLCFVVYHQDMYMYTAIKL